uniref:MULE transposase domain-containing protein n=1 Tax=Lactuca sativa TaxID=4236 RepID=A0A9R1UY45_LACSA|nr:hypothetical protein LSAT_V11C700357190 [Lactuca sativa]
MKMLNIQVIKTITTVFQVSVLLLQLMHIQVLHDIKPDVTEEFKLTKSMRFKDVLEGVNFYKNKICKASFDVCLNTLSKAGDIIKHRYKRVSIGLKSFNKCTTTNLMSYFSLKFQGVFDILTRSSLFGLLQRKWNQLLNAMFWADETNKAYYSEFGDAMSFNATFCTNKYALVFVPFTVIDHHKSSITVGAGLLSTKDVDSYKWLLEQFLKAHKINK